MVDAVDQLAELRATDADHIADFMGKALARAAPVLRRGKHGAQIQHEAIGILMVIAHGLTNQIQRVTANF